MQYLQIMTFDEKTIIIWRHLAELPKRQGVLKDLLEELNIEYSATDLSGFKDAFNKSQFFKTKSLPKGGLLIIMNQIGYSKIKNLESERKKVQEEKQLKELQRTSLENSVSSFDNQNQFWVTSINRNEEQIKVLQDQQWLMWLNLGLSMLALIISAFAIYNQIQD